MPDGAPGRGSASDSVRARDALEVIPSLISLWYKEGASTECAAAALVGPDVVNALLNAITLYLLSLIIYRRFRLDRPEEHRGE